MATASPIANRLCVALACALLAVSPARADEAPAKDYANDAFYRELTAKSEALKTQQDGDVQFHKFFVDRINAAPNNSRAALQWLRDRVLGGDPNVFYPLYYSELLYSTAKGLGRSGDKAHAVELYESSYLMLRIFQIMAITDAVRCEDTTATDPVMKLASSRLAGMKEEAKAFDAKAWETLNTFPLAYEQKYATRPASDEAVCRSGQEAIKQAMADPKHTDTVENGKHIIKSLIPYKPNFISDEAWQEKRKEVRDMLEKQWKDAHKP